MLQPWRYFQDVSYAGYKFGFNGMMCDDDIKEQAPGISKKGTGNSYDYGARFYDPRVGRWWSLDPKPTASESWYAGMGNNPIMNTDVNGDWAWIANNHINNNKGWQTDITKIATLGVAKSFNIIHNTTIKYLENQMNISFVNVWSDPKNSHYAPIIANYVKDENNKIPVAIGNYPENSSKTGQCINKNLITINYLKTIIKGNNANNFEGVLLHEIVHEMGGDEYDAYSASIATGYMKPEVYISKITYYPENFEFGTEVFEKFQDKQDLLFYIPESVQKECFKDEKLINPKLLIQRMIERGNELTGSKNNAQNDSKPQNEKNETPKTD